MVGKAADKFSGGRIAFSVSTLSSSVFGGGALSTNKQRFSRARGVWNSDANDISESDESSTISTKALEGGAKL